MILLLCGDDAAGALSGIESGSALDDGLTGSTTGAELAPDLSDGIPLRHDD